MRGPYRRRMVHTPPRFRNFKPSGIPSRFLQTVELTVDEFEAIRLADYEQLDQQQAADKMNISRPTFTRLIEKARYKLAQSLVEGKELVIEGGNIDFVNTIHHCQECDEFFYEPFTDEKSVCPNCKSENVENLALRFLGRCGEGRHGHRRRGRNMDQDDDVN